MRMDSSFKRHPFARPARNELISPLRFPIALTLVGTAIGTLAHAVSAETNLTCVPATKVQVADAFWKPLLDRNRAVTIPHNLRMCRESGNARVAATHRYRPGRFHPVSSTFLDWAF